MNPPVRGFDIFIVRYILRGRASDDISLGGGREQTALFISLLSLIEYMADAVFSLTVKD